MLYAQLSWISTVISWLTSTLVPLPLSFDERLWSSLSATTKTSYRRALREFLSWAADSSIPEPCTLHQLDAVLLQYLLSGVKTTKFRILLAAVEKSCPPAKRQLPYAYAYLADAERRVPPRHTVPLSYVAAAGTAWVLASKFGQPRIAGLLMLQVLLGLRPSEAIAIQRQHLVPAHMNRSSPGTAVVLLGVKHGTKIGRPQYVTVDSPLACMLISAFYNTTPAGALLSNVATYGGYKSLLDRAWRDQGLSGMGWTPHSARAGWATEERLRGVPIIELKARGRWASDKSLAAYIDISTNMLMEQQIGPLADLGSWLLNDFMPRFPWW